MIYIIILIILYLLFFMIHTKKNSKEIKGTIDSNLYKQKKIMTDYEKYFYHVLSKLETELPIKIHPQINLATIVTKTKENRYINELFRIIDFAIFTKDYEKLLLLIEINDKTHRQKKRYRRDQKVKQILSIANIKLITFYTEYSNQEDYILNRIRKELHDQENDFQIQKTI